MLACQRTSSIFAVKIRFEVLCLMAWDFIDFRIACCYSRCALSLKETISQWLNILSLSSANYSRKHDSRIFKASVDRKAYWSFSWFLLLGIEQQDYLLLHKPYFLSHCTTWKSLVCCDMGHCLSGISPAAVHCITAAVQNSKGKVVTWKVLPSEMSTAPVLIHH